MNYKNYIIYVIVSVIFVVLIVYQRMSLNTEIFLQKRNVEDLPHKDNIKNQITNSVNEANILKNEEDNKHYQNNNKGYILRDPAEDSIELKMYSGLRNCSREEPVKRFVQKGEFWIFENYIIANKRFRCDESITYTTHGEYGFLDNLITLTSRWQGPVSVAVYCPGKDFRAALETIFHLRNCVSNDVKKYATFHLFFEKDHFPKMIPNNYELSQLKTSCNKDLSLFKERVTYRHEQKLLYPVNVARNIAIANAKTFFVLPSDIELFPSVSIIPEFFKMLRNHDVSNTTNKRVYVLPVFEIQKDQFPPETKLGLLAMLEAKKAFLFHENICHQCHTPPKYDKWLKTEFTPGLSVLHIGKRHKPHKTWEPFYIGTDEEPVFDERLTSEGRGNKMTQAYAMCLLDYEYHILNNAFLVHKPGIKYLNRTILRSNFVKTQNELIFSTISEEYKKLYGNKKECHVMGPH